MSEAFALFYQYCRKTEPTRPPRNHVQCEQTLVPRCPFPLYFKFKDTKLHTSTTRRSLPLGVVDSPWSCIQHLSEGHFSHIVFGRESGTFSWNCWIIFPASGGCSSFKPSPISFWPFSPWHALFWMRTTILNLPTNFRQNHTVSHFVMFTNREYRRIV